MNHPEPTFELNEASFLRLFVKHEPSLRAYARSIVPDWHLVDEAMQESSVVMWQKRDQLQDESGFAPWAKVILRFKCLKQIEKLRLERPLLSDSMISTLSSRSEEKTAVVEAERLNAFQKCFSQLSVEHQKLLLAPHTQQLSVKTIAEKKNRTVNSLYKAMGRIRKKLTSCIRQRLVAGSAI